MRHRGFTLIELMVTIAVAAIIVTLAIPSFEAIINGNRLSSAANEMMASLQTARMEAIRHNRRAAVCLSVNADTANPTCVAANATDANGWITFVDRNTDGDYDSAGDTLLRVTTSHERVQILGSSNIPGRVGVVFLSDGFARQAGGAFLNGAIDMCIQTNKPPENVRRILIGSGGRISISSESIAGPCGAPPNPAAL